MLDTLGLLRSSLVGWVVFGTPLGLPCTRTIPDQPPTLSSNQQLLLLCVVRSKQWVECGLGGAQWFTGIIAGY